MGMIPKREILQVPINNKMGKLDIYKREII